MPYKRKLPGIYLITNWVTGQSYVGSSTAVQDRLANHKALLRAGQGHHNKHLQASFTKYGEDHFSFELLELCPERLLEEREKHWIQSYDAVNSGFNTSLDVKCPARGRKQTKEEIARRAQACCKLRKFVDPNGQMFETTNTRAFAAEYGLNYEGLTCVANGNRLSWHGWTCVRAEQPRIER